MLRLALRYSLIAGQTPIFAEPNTYLHPEKTFDKYGYPSGHLRNAEVAKTRSSNLVVETHHATKQSYRSPELCPKGICGYSQLSVDVAKEKIYRMFP